MGNGQIGLDGGKASSALSTTETNYDSIMEVLGTGFQTAVIGPLAGCWFGKDAKDLMGKLKEVIEGAGGEFEKIFSSINETVTQNAQAFEQQHGASVFSPVAHAVKKVVADVSSAKEDLGGFVGIKDPSQFEAAINAFKSNNQTVGTLVKGAKTALSDSGFYGEGQQEALDASTTKIEGNLAELLQEIVDATKDKLDEAKQAEQELAKKSAQAFGGQ
jgi:DNA anti-recombination protein RmuC